MIFSENRYPLFGIMLYSAQTAFITEISHGSRQTRRHLARQAQESPQGRQGLLRPAQEYDPYRQAGGGEGPSIRLPRPQAAQAPFPRVGDPPLNPRGAPLWPPLQPFYRRAPQV